MKGPDPEIDGPIDRPTMTADWLKGPKPTTIDAANVALRFAEEVLREEREDRRVREGKAPGEEPTSTPDYFRRFQAAALYHAFDIIKAIVGHEPQVRSLVKGRNDAARAKVLAKRDKDPAPESEAVS